MESLGFSDIIMFETLVRTHEPVSVPMPKVDDAVRRIKEVEKKKQARRERQISESKQRRQTTTQKEFSTKPDSPGFTTKRVLEGADHAKEPEPKKPRDETCNGPVNYITSEETRTIKVEDSEPVEFVAAPKVEQTAVEPCTLNSAVESKQTGESEKAPSLSPNILETSKPAGMSRGHTSFLTFAVLLPLPKS